MRGEIGFIIQDIKIVGDNHFLEETSSNVVREDLEIIGKDEDHLWIFGDNDWTALMVKTLIPFMRTAAETSKKVEIEFKKLRHENKVPAVVRLGKTEFRQLNLLHIINTMGDHMTTILGVPVIQSDKTHEIKVFSEDQELKYYKFE